MYVASVMLLIMFIGLCEFSVLMRLWSQAFVFICTSCTSFRIRVRVSL